MQRPNSNIGLYFHQLSKDISWGGKVRIPKDVKDYPKSWVNVEYKTYENTPKIKLLEKKQTILEAKLTDMIVNRVSKRDFRDIEINIKEISTIINFSISLKDRDADFSGRVHPSGGGRYSIEHYFLIQKSSELETGIYHYNIKTHQLEFLTQISKKDLPTISKAYAWVQEAGLVWFMTSIFDRNMRKYGERGYRYILKEAGHIAQNIYLVSTALNLPVCSVEGTSDLLIEEILGIDGEGESIINTMVI